MVVTTERHLHHAEITLQFYDHQLVGIGSDADLFTALSAALEKLEKQAVKQRAKWREKKPPLRYLGAAASKLPQSPQSDDDEVGQLARGFSASTITNGRKPMTLEEALLEMEKDRDYLVYRDADTAMHVGAGSPARRSLRSHRILTAAQDALEAR